MAFDVSESSGNTAAVESSDGIIEPFAIGTNYVVCPTNQTVNVRQYANSTSAVLAYINNGIAVNVDAVSGSYSHITSPTPAGYILSSLLTTSPAWMARYGSGTSNQNTNAQVRALQTDLKSNLGISLTIDGIYGSATQAAVSQFQNKYGLSADGLAGSVTKAWLYNKTH